MVPRKALPRNAIFSGRALPWRPTRLVFHVFFSFVGTFLRPPQSVLSLCFTLLFYLGILESDEVCACGGAVGMSIVSLMMVSRTEAHTKRGALVFRPGCLGFWLVKGMGSDFFERAQKLLDGAFTETLAGPASTDQRKGHDGVW